MVDAAFGATTYVETKISKIGERVGVGGIGEISNHRVQSENSELLLEILLKVI